MRIGPKSFDDCSQTHMSNFQPSRSSPVRFLDLIRMSGQGSWLLVYVKPTCKQANLTLNRSFIGTQNRSSFRCESCIFHRQQKHVADSHCRVVMIAFVAVAAEFIYRWKRDIPFKGREYLDMSKKSAPTVSALEEISDRRRWKTLLGALSAATLLIFIRSIYRTIELLGPSSCSCSLS